MRISSLALVLAAAFATTSAQTDIRKVDFKNFTYSPSCTGEKPEKVTVKNGELSREKQEDGYVDRFYFKVFHVTYGDLNGDGTEEAIVLSVCNTGGTGNFSEGSVYSMKNGKPAVLANIEGGDRAEGGLRSARVENGLLVIESNDPGENGGACCPQVVVTTRTRLSNGKLLTVGKEERRDLFPKQRVSFARGASSADVELTIPSEEGKRLIVGARAGQTLEVKVSNEKISAQLEDDGDAAQAPDGFRVKLTKSGDQTIRLTNYEDTSVKVVVTIRIT